MQRAAACDAGRQGRQQRSRERARCAALARRLDGRPDDDPPIPPTIEVWHSVREHGDALRTHRKAQDAVRDAAGRAWHDTGLVFTSKVGTELDAANVRRAFRRVVRAAGLDQAAWTPRELRHSIVSIVSDNGVSLEEIADLCGHAGTTVTEKVYRFQLRPVLLNGATPWTGSSQAAPSHEG